MGGILGQFAVAGICDDGADLPIKFSVRGIPRGQPSGLLPDIFIEKNIADVILAVIPFFEAVQIPVVKMSVILVKIIVIADIAEIEIRFCSHY